MNIYGVKSKMQKRLCSVIRRTLPRGARAQDGIVNFSRRLYASEAAKDQIASSSRVRRLGSRDIWHMRSKKGHFTETEHSLDTKTGVRLYDSSDRLCYFDEIYLRDSCRCKSCVDEHSGNKKFYTADIPANIKVRDVQLFWENFTGSPDDQIIKIKWMNDVPGFDQDHETILHPSMLVKTLEAYNAEVRSYLPHPEIGPYWTGTFAKQNIKTYSYGDFMKDDEPFYNAVLQLEQHGLIFIENVPESEQSIESIGNRIGPLKNTFYGYTWDVKDKPQAENVAYTSGYLGLHMDLLYMKQPPGLQLLHCIRSSEEGGESIFADSFAAAKMMSIDHPAHFETLANFEVPYHYYKGGNHYFDTKPTFDLGRTPGLQYHQKITNMGPLRLKNVNWSPPFQGQFDFRALEDTTKVRSYHEAARIFHEIVNKTSMLYQRRLKPGECTIFNNRRILHGRQAFTSAGERFLKGAYIDRDPFDSIVTRLQKEGNWKQGQTRTTGGKLENQVTDNDLAKLAATLLS